MKCRINVYKLEEFIGCEITNISLEYNCLYVEDKDCSEKLVDYLELFGVIGEVFESYKYIVDIKNGEITGESYGNALLGDGSIKPSFTITIDEDKRII
ncbi:MAG: hypothetical protein J6Y78_10720 [Paludibacteraceae bacterium]|nr:hypothetical protein [Paludibacteraceae bacterium]